VSSFLTTHQHKIGRSVPYMVKISYRSDSRILLKQSNLLQQNAANMVIHCWQSMHLAQTSCTKLAWVSWYFNLLHFTRKQGVYTTPLQLHRASIS